MKNYYETKHGYVAFVKDSDDKKALSFIYSFSERHTWRLSGWVNHIHKDACVVLLLLELDEEPVCKTFITLCLLIHRHRKVEICRPKFGVNLVVDSRYKAVTDVLFHSYRVLWFVFIINFHSTNLATFTYAAKEKFPFFKGNRLTAIGYLLPSEEQ